MDNHDIEWLDTKVNQWAHSSITDKEFMFWICAFTETQRDKARKENE